VERWKPITGYENCYEVSDQGRVRSLPRLVHTLTPAGPRQRPIPGGVLAPGVRKDGRLIVGLHREGVRRTRLIHQLVAEAFIGARPEGMECCHENGNPQDNRATNLRWDTRRNNALDQRRHGTVYQLNIDKCPRGHRLAAPNLVRYHFNELGKRLCLACHKTHKKAATARRREMDFDFQAVADVLYSEIISLLSN
jgi:hypothetical protein